MRHQKSQLQPRNLTTIERHDHKPSKGFGKSDSGIRLEIGHEKPLPFQVLLREECFSSRFQASNSSSTNSAGQNDRTGTVLVPKPLETKAVVCSLINPIW